MTVDQLGWEAGWTKDALVLDDVLFEFDGPMIFTSSFGAFKAFFSRIDEEDGLHRYAVGTVSDEVMAGIKAGELSVRAALLSEPCFLMDLDGLVVQRYCRVPVAEMPLDMLPASGFTIIPGEVNAPDSLAQRNAYFSVRFSGEKIASDKMMFSLFKGLVDRVYDSSRKLLAPLIMENAKSATYDYPIGPPVFGSLVLNLEPPTLAPGNVKRHLKRTDLDVNLMREIFDESRDEFFDEMDDLVEEASEQDMSIASAEKHIRLLGHLQEIIPHEESDFSKVEFHASVGGQLRTVVVSEKVGERLKRAHYAAVGDKLTFSGHITIINDKRGTFVMERDTGRELTCNLGDDDFALLEADPRFKGKAKVIVIGNFYKRSRRDYIAVETVTLVDEEQDNVFG